MNIRFVLFVILGSLIGYGLWRMTPKDKVRLLLRETWFVVIAIAVAILFVVILWSLTL